MLNIKVLDQNGSSITCDENESLLDASNRQGVKIPYACKGGGCGLCKVKIEEGEYFRKKMSMAALPESERELNYTLACKTYPRSNITILTDLPKVANPL